MSTISSPRAFKELGIDPLALHDAVSDENIYLIENLIKHDRGMFCYHRDEDGNTALHVICIRGK